MGSAAMSAVDRRGSIPRSAPLSCVSCCGLSSHRTDSRDGQGRAASAGSTRSAAGPRSRAWSSGPMGGPVILPIGPPIGPPITPGQTIFSSSLVQWSNHIALLIHVRARARMRALWSLGLIDWTIGPRPSKICFYLRIQLVQWVVQRRFRLDQRSGTGPAGASRAARSSPSPRRAEGCWVGPAPASRRWIYQASSSRDRSILDQAGVARWSKYSTYCS